MKGERSITRVPLKEVPPQRGTRVSPLEPIVREVLALPCDEAIRLPVGNLHEAQKLAPRLARLVNDRGKGCRVRTKPDAVYVWLDPDLDSSAWRNRRGRRKEPMR